MIKHVYDFNKMRNKFEWDAELEKEMYQEECREFFDANSMAERLDAVVDCQYVRLGTELKMAANGIKVMPYVNRETVMHEILMVEISKKFSTVDSYSINNVSCGGPNIYEKVLKKAQKIVCEANELKGLAKSDNGKVLKDAAYEYKINATVLISVMLEKELANAED